MTVKSRICAINVLEHISKNKEYADKIGINGKMQQKNKRKCGQKEDEFLVIKNRTKNKGK